MRVPSLRGMWIGLALGLGACGENQLHSLDTSDSAEQEGSSDNQAPSAPIVRIIPEAPSASDELFCQRTQASEDPEGEPVSYQISWEVDGQLTDQATDRVSSDLTSADQSWACLQIASDGQRKSVPGMDTVRIVPQNRPPEAPVVRISPSSPGENHGLECLVIEESSDPDGDPVAYTYAWTVNGESSEYIDAEVSSEWTVVGDSWACMVTPSDDELEGESASDSVEIGEASYGSDVTGESGVVYDASDCAYCPDETWYTPDKAFDDNLGTSANSWVVPWDGGPEWISVDFGAGNEQTITYYGLMGSAFHEGYRARDWQLEASDDEVSWEVLHQVTDADLAYVMYGGEPFTYYGFSNTRAYRYYRYYVTENMGGQPYNNELGIVEIEMMENSIAE